MKIILGIAVTAATVAGAAFLLKKGADACKKANECCEEAEKKESCLSDAADWKISHEQAEMHHILNAEKFKETNKTKADALEAARTDASIIVKSLADAASQLGIVIKTEASMHRDKFLNTLKTYESKVEKPASTMSDYDPVENEF